MLPLSATFTQIPQDAREENIRVYRNANYP
jgi:hypothetical protein